MLLRGWAISITREYRPGNKPQGHCPEHPVWHVHPKANRSSESYLNGSGPSLENGFDLCKLVAQASQCMQQVWSWCTGYYKHCVHYHHLGSNRVGLRTLPVIHGGRYGVRLTPGAL